MTTPEPPAAQPAPTTPGPLAEWATRAIGFVIDYLPILILSLLTFWIDFLGFITGLVGIAYWVYMGYLDGETGQTPGKAVQGITVVDQNGALLGSGAGIGRKFLHILDSLVCLLGWFLPIVDQKRQTIADKVMTSYVVTGAEKKAFAVDLWMPPQQGSPPQATPEA
jgi:uncharacterized RDD family membrane protein YckC